MIKSKSYFNLSALEATIDDEQLELLSQSSDDSSLPMRKERLLQRCKSVVPPDAELSDACSDSDDEQAAESSDACSDSDDWRQMPRFAPIMSSEVRSTMFFVEKPTPTSHSGLMRAHDGKGIVDAEKNAKKRLRNNDTAVSTTETASTMVKKVRSEEPHVRPLSAMELSFPVPMLGQKDLTLSDTGNNKAAPSPSDITAVLK